MFCIFTDMSKIEILPEGNFDKHYPLICHEVQLLRLGSEKVDFEAAHLLSDVNSASGYYRKSKFVGNKVVTEAEVHHHNKPQSVNHKQNSSSYHESTCKKLEEIELDTKMSNQDDNVIVINESKVRSISMKMCCLSPSNIRRL